MCALGGGGRYTNCIMRKHSSGHCAQWRAKDGKITVPNFCDGQEKRSVGGGARMPLLRSSPCFARVHLVLPTHASVASRDRPCAAIMELVWCCGMSLAALTCLCWLRYYAHARAHASAVPWLAAVNSCGNVAILTASRHW